MEHVFTCCWEVFRTGSGINDESAPSQLFQCAENELGYSLLKATPHPASNTLSDLLAAMRSLTVIPVATDVLHTELLRKSGKGRTVGLHIYSKGMWESRNLRLHYKV